MVQRDVHFWNIHQLWASEYCLKAIKTMHYYNHSSKSEALLNLPISHAIHKHIMYCKSSHNEFERIGRKHYNFITFNNKLFSGQKFAILFPLAIII